MSYKSNYTCILPSYVCAFTHFLPLSSMTTCKVIQVHQVRIFRELRTSTHHTTILNILRECVARIFLYPPSQTPVVAYFLPGHPGKNTLTTHSTILNIIHECVTHSFLSIHEHPRGNHVNKVQQVSLFKTTAQLIYCSHYLRKAVSL